jgi:hypothetical protein
MPTGTGEVPEMIRLAWAEGSHIVEWDYGGTHTTIALDQVPVAVVGWAEPPSVIVLEPMGERVDNAVVYNPDGTQRLRLVPPSVIAAESSWRPGFYTIYTSLGVLTAVYSTSAGDFWGVPDLRSGQLANVTRWR